MHHLINILPAFIKNNSFINFFYSKIFKRAYLNKQQKVYNLLKQIENLTITEKQDIQNELLNNILITSYQNCAYYKKIFNENNVNLNDPLTFKRIPFLTKDIVRKNSKEIINCNFKSRNLISRNTGGSTGEPFEFYSDKLSGAIDNAHHEYLYNIIGKEKNDIVIGAGGVYLSKRLRNKNIFWKKNNKNNIWSTYDFSVLYITDYNINFYVNKLIELKPSILRGYPSFFDKIASYLLKNNINLNFKVKGIVLTAEMCTVEQRKNIEKAFSTLIFFEYGHSEISVFCYTNDNSYIYKPSPIYGYVEVVKDDGTDAETGEIGEIIVTGFCNLGMPFIRYRTGDLGEVFSKNGGIVKLKRIIGRTQDYILSKENQKVFLTALIFGQHLNAFKKISKWQIIQNKIGLVKLKIVKLEGFTKEDEQEIIKKFINAANIDIEFEYVNFIPATKNGKHLFLIQNINHD
ncbi:MAG: hypothetical protein RBT49_10290 [Bacteroidales bacterium]|jgi:phenylacetate-CoA ligase|nr:hypothetical protein [Bacteroidales bacterium]